MERKRLAAVPHRTPSALARPRAAYAGRGSAHVHSRRLLSLTQRITSLTTGELVLDRLNHRSSVFQLRRVRLRSASFDDRCASKPWEGGQGWGWGEGEGRREGEGLYRRLAA